MELTWHPGKAQVNFGPACVRERGRPVRIHFLCVTCPYSNAGYLQLFRGETAECVVHGLVDIWHHMGGAPRRIIFDNARGVGRRVEETLRLTELFQRCQAHYGFETTFCNPAAGYEQGHVENTVWFFRRNLLVPVPEASDRAATSRELLTRSEVHGARRHYKKGQPVETLFAVDREALNPPRSPGIRA